MTDPDIEALVRSFEDGSLPRSEWTHARHLVPALWYIRRHGRDVATGLIRDGIRRDNERHGDRTGYHETITPAWVAVIQRLLSDHDRGVPVSVLAERLTEECGDTDDLLRFDSGERLFSDEARHRRVPPDLGDLASMGTALAAGDLLREADHLLL